jgi:hypothetical protein
MKKAFCPILAFLLVSLAAQGGETGLNQDERIETVSADFLFSNVVIKLKEEKLISGLLTGMSSSALILRTGGRDESIDFKNISRVSIGRDPEHGQGMLYGILLGIYGGNLLFHGAKDQPAVFLRGNIENSWLLQLAFFAAGAGMGYAAEAALEKDSISFDLKGSDIDRQAEWDRLRRILSGSMNIEPRKFHVSVYGGKVFLNIANRYSNIFKKTGCNVNEYEYSYYNYHHPVYDYAQIASSLNLVRRLQFTVSLNPRLETGVAVMFLGEPSVSGEKYSNNYNNESWAGVKLTSTAYYACGLYQPLRGLLPSRLQWRIGMGLGAAKVNFNLKTSNGYSIPLNPYWVDEKTEFGISRWFLSGVVFTEITVPLSSFFSLGLAADYAWIPSQQAPGYPNPQIPAQKLRLGNASLGAAFSFHF